MKRFKHILCIVEPGEESKHALEKAVALAENNQANLTVASVIERISAGIGLPDGGPISTELQAAMASEREQKLHSLLEPHRNRIDIETRNLKGTPFLEIIREVLRNGHDLVIKSPESQEWLNRIFGSNDMHLLRKCPCPVWIIRTEAPQNYRSILAAVDVPVGYPASELKKRHALSRKILEIAGSLALSEFAELHIVHVWEAIGESTMRGAFARVPERQIIAYVEQVRREHAQALNIVIQEVEEKLGRDVFDYLKPKVHLVKGWARKEIPLLAKQLNTDLVIMGTVARTGIPGFIMGNTAETILNQIDCSVLAIKPPGFVTPVSE